MILNYGVTNECLKIRKSWKNAWRKTDLTDLWIKCGWARFSRPEFLYSYAINDYDYDYENVLNKSPVNSTIIVT